MCVYLSPGKAGELIDGGDNTYGGKFVVNPSGGLISKGHPLGATGTLSLWYLTLLKYCKGTKADQGQKASVTFTYILLKHKTLTTQHYSS